MARYGSQRGAGKEQFWRRLITLWRRSQPITVREFCFEHEVSEPSFYSWRRTLAQRDLARPSSIKPARRQGGPRASQQQPARFVPLTIVPTPTGNHGDLHIVLDSGLVIRVPPGFDAATLRKLLAVLNEEQPC